MNIPEDAEFIPGVRLRDKATPGLPPELELVGDYYGGDPDGLWLVETVLGERLTAMQWNARFRQWRDGIIPGPQDDLTAEDRARLETVISGMAFRHPDHLRHAVAAQLTKAVKSRREACESAINVHGPAGAGVVYRARGGTSQFYTAVGEASRLFKAPD